MNRDLFASENYLLHSCLDFSATYMAVSMLEYELDKDSSLASSQTVHALHRVIEKKIHSRQRQSYFLYRKAAKTLRFLAADRENTDLARESLESLKHIVAHSHGPSHRAAAEALGSLPLEIKGPSLHEESTTKISSITWHELCRKTGLNESCHMKCMGRSLVFSLSKDLVFVMKLSRSNSDNAALNREALWMTYLQTIKHEFPVRFDIPTPYRFKKAHVFRLTEVPNKLKNSVNRPMSSAIGFTVHPDYFVYPNPFPDEENIDGNNFMEVMKRNAYLLGRLASMGIVHTAPLPLFHNRIQRHRRCDGGYYEWPRGGRLDRWLMSCRYPNLGKSGIRDFEHLESIPGTRSEYYRFVGNHLISIILIGASYFRNHDPERTGFNKKGFPVDARNLFCPDFMQKLIEESFNAYYEGFTGRKTGNCLPVDFDNFVSRLIDEFGVDRYMEEIFRVADQREMSDVEFSEFLFAHGFNRNFIQGLTKGLEDITLLTGPHLGNFNQRISLPELIHFTETATAYCICDRYIFDQHPYCPTGKTSDVSIHK